MTDPDEGAEKITISSLWPDFGISPKHQLSLSDLDGAEVEEVGLADPHSFMIVKGWTRMFCLYTVLLCCQQQPGFLEARPINSECLYVTMFDCARRSRIWTKSAWDTYNVMPFSIQTVSRTFRTLHCVVIKVDEPGELIARNRCRWNNLFFALHFGSTIMMRHL